MIKKTIFFLLTITITFATKAFSLQESKVLFCGEYEGAYYLLLENNTLWQMTSDSEEISSSIQKGDVIQIGKTDPYYSLIYECDTFFGTEIKKIYAQVLYNVTSETESSAFLLESKILPTQVIATGPLSMDFSFLEFLADSSNIEIDDDNPKLCYYVVTDDRVFLLTTKTFQKTDSLYLFEDFVINISQNSMVTDDDIIPIGLMKKIEKRTIEDISNTTYIEGIGFMEIFLDDASTWNVLAANANTILEKKNQPFTALKFTVLPEWYFFFSMLMENADFLIENEYIILQDPQIEHPLILGWRQKTE